MNSEYKKTTLGKEFKLYQPKTLAKKNLDIKGKYSVYGANGIIGKHSKFNHFESEVLIGCRGTCGNVMLSQSKSWINGNVMVVKPRTKNVYKKYLKYYLDSQIHFKNIITGASQPQITRRSLENIEIIIPPLKEQWRVTKILNIADSIYYNSNQAVTKLDKLAQSIFIDTFQDNKKFLKLKEVGKFVNGGTPTKKKIEFWKGNIPWISSADIEKEEIKVIRHFITKNAIEKSATKLFPKKNVLIVTRTGVGKVVVNEKDICFSQDITGLILKPEYEPNFIATAIRTKENEIKNQLRGATIKGVTREVIENLEIPLTPYAQQKKFLEKIHLINKLKIIYSNKIELVDKMISSLKNQLFAKRKYE